jgi:hypothetical protein
MRHGESFDNMRTRNKQLQDGNLPWTEEEDTVLRTRYEVYADHPLGFTLICAELPEESRRTPKGVQKRCGELGLVKTKANHELFDKMHPPAEEGSPSKKQKLDSPSKAEEVDLDMPMFQEEDIDSLEMDLEKLLDAEESRRAFETEPSTSSASASGQPAAPASENAAQTALDTQEDTQPGLGLDLELELEAMIDEGDSLPFEESLPETQAATIPDPATAMTAPAATAPEPGSIEADLEDIMGDSLTQEPPVSQASATLEEEMATILEASGLNTQSPAKSAQSPAASPAKSARGGESGDEASFWDNAVEADLPEDIATQRLGAAPEGASQRSEQIAGSQLSQESTLEMALEKIMDMDMDESQTQVRESGA